MKSVLPIILIVLVLTGAVTYSLAKKAINSKQEVSRFGISANKLTDITSPNPKTSPTATATIKPLATPTSTPTPTISPKISPIALPLTAESDPKTDSSTTQSQVGSTTKSIVCTPVYGMANICTEHIVVDTGAADSIFFNFAGISYFAGLVSFVRAKTLKK